MIKNEIKSSDFILSIASFLENGLKDEIINSNADFIYMHPIDKSCLKNRYKQFIKYEVGSEEAIFALLLNFFATNLDEDLENYLDELDIGYLSAESSAGEEEFEEILEDYKNAKNPLLLVGEDIINHKRERNILNILKKLEEFSKFKIVFASNNLKTSNDQAEELEEVEDLKSFNGTVLYKTSINSDFLIASQTFANIAKVKDGDSINILSKDESFKKVLKVDTNLLGTIALIDISNSKDENSYKYLQVKIEKAE